MDYIKKIGHGLTGLKITTKQDESTHIVYKSLYINFNREQLDNEISKDEYIKRGVILEYKYIYVILHEVAHYRKYKKFKNGRDYWEYCYTGNEKYIQKLCDRYARRYASRFIK